MKVLICVCILVALLSGMCCTAEGISATQMQQDEAGFMVYTTRDTRLYSSADASRVLCTIPAETVVYTAGVQHGMAQVRYQDMDGYASADSFLASFSSSDFASSVNRYYLFLDKSLFTLFVYTANENGQKTDTLVRSIPVAIGKRSTPTPVGIFTLGEKEDWHDFTHTSAPFCTAYTNGRYLHGPLYEQHNFDTLCEYSLEDIGHMRTSGCLRMAYDDAAWLYFNCLSTETTLEIVNKAEDGASENVQ